MSSGRERNERLLREGVEAFNAATASHCWRCSIPGSSAHVAPGLGNPGYADRQSAMNAVR